MNSLSSPFKIRRALHKDARKISEHNIAMAQETEGRSLDREVARKGVEAVLVNPSKGFYIVVERDDAVIAQCMITFEWSDWRRGDFWWIQSVYVEKEWRNQGVFSLLFEHIEREARMDQGVVGLRLYVDMDNKNAQQAYRKVGMKETHYNIFEINFALE